MLNYWFGCPRTSPGHGYDQGDEGDDDDRRGDQLEAARAIVGQAAQPPDHRDGSQDDEPGDDVLLQHDAADGGERQRRPGPGQRGPRPGQAGVAVLVIVLAGRHRWAVIAGPSSQGRHRRAETRTTTAARTAMT